jgi:hypothetical protein
VSDKLSEDLSATGGIVAALKRRRLLTTIGPWGATVELVVARALLRFRSLPRNVRFLWIVAAFIALNVLVRLVG